MPRGAYFSHTTAAALLGMPLPPGVVQRVLHVSVPAPRTAPHGRGIAGHSIGGLSGTDVEGLPVCTPALVWAQVAGHVQREELVALGDDLIGSRTRPPRTSVEELTVTSARSPRTKGARARSWALPRLRFGADSRPESLLRLLLEERGWPKLDVNRPVAVDGGRLTLHPDLCDPERRIAFEYEGDGHRVDRQQWFRDIERRELLEAAGWRVVRVTASDLFHHRDAFVARLQRFAPNLGSEAARTEIWGKS